MLYSKLVRDKIPQIIEESGKRAITYALSDKEYEVFLERKLDEETLEYHESKDAEELADILEVVVALAEHKGLSFEDLMALRNEKAEKKGSFSERIFLVAVSED
jgi:predicted house-cleaning noncanonical NTP pyrophosphatase (MazG superfamily)